MDRQVNCGEQLMFEVNITGVIKAGEGEVTDVRTNRLRTKN